MWELAGKFYGESRKWGKIWKVNKKGMMKGRKGNIRQGGEWMFRGEKLKIGE